MSILLYVVAPVFLVVLAGTVAARFGLIEEPVMDGLARFAQSVAIPCLLFRAVAAIDLEASFDIALLVAFYVPALLCFALGTVGARLIFARSMPDAIVIGFCCLFSNSVLLGLPITERAFGADALGPVFAIIALHAPVCYAVGIGTMEVAHAGLSIGALGRIAKRAFGNALVIAILAGLAVNVAGLAIPRVLGEATDLLARAGLPTALFALGGVLARYRPAGDLRVAGMVAALSLLVHPALVWAMGTAANLEPGAFRSAVVTASMAPGVNAYLFAVLYGGAMRVAAASVLICTILSLLTASFWLSLLTH